MSKRIPKINHREVSSAQLKSEFLSRLENKLQSVNEVKRVTIRPRHKLDIDASIRIIISSHRSLELSKRIAEAISEAKWEVFEELGELPAVEWEIEREPVKPQKKKRIYRWIKPAFRYERKQTRKRISKRQIRRTPLRISNLNRQEIDLGE